jgi:predicted ATPase
LRLARGAGGLSRPSLPTPLTALIGREQDLRELKSRLAASGVRLLTLAGPPGVGKTRLALELAADVEETFSHGAAFIALAAIRDPALVIETIARA